MTLKVEMEKTDKINDMDEIKNSDDIESWNKKKIKIKRTLLKMAK